MDKSSSVMEIKGVGEKTGKLFSKLSLFTVNDLLHFYPREYDTYEKPIRISDITSGGIRAIYAAVTEFPAERKVRNLSILHVWVSDGSERLGITFYNMSYLRKQLKVGGYYIFRGAIRKKSNQWVMEQPRIFDYGAYMQQTSTLLPVYHLTKGLTNHAVSKAVQQSMPLLDDMQEKYPEDFLQKYELIKESEALRMIHHPAGMDEVIKARKRIVFDEFFLFLYQLHNHKAQCSNLPNRYRMFETADTVRFLEQLPFPLTNAQKRVWQEIRDDLSSPVTMNRLVQGDVGSGKTILAILALLLVAANGYQGALMAPTEVLAVQHYETIVEYTRKYNLCFKPVLLVGSMTASQKRESRRLIEDNEVNIVIGTHALIQDKVKYASLALAVTDEQHRFGVSQRGNLAEKGHDPHILVMSATPIPRTLAIILYGDLQLSVVDELPQGRLPVKNCVVGTQYRETAYRFIQEEVKKGRQIYCICPQIDGEDSSDLENVQDYTEKLKNILDPSVRVSCLHGKMRPAEKNRIMEEFANHNIDVLVSTTVIEVGINVPNATVMLVENAERFGLAQLHQLRGRVGRGEHQSFCIFISSNERKETMERLGILNKSNDGFFIAAQDLKLRGPGDLFGIRQSGEFEFRMGDIYSDADTLQLAASAVTALCASDPLLEQEKYHRLKCWMESSEANNIDFRSI